MQPQQNKFMQETEEATVNALDALGATGQARQRLLDDALQRARNELTPITSPKEVPL